MQDCWATRVTNVGAISRSRAIATSASLLSFTLVLLFNQASAAPILQPGPLGIAMEGYDYPFPLHYLNLRTEKQDIRMAHMDVRPQARTNGKTVVLMHGKNFFGAYWAGTIPLLSEHGFRVLVPD